MFSRSTTIAFSSTRTASPCPPDGTYHRDIGLPAGAAKQFVGHFKIVLTRHAMHAAVDDRYGPVRFCRGRELAIEENQVVEVTFENSRIVKGVVRVPYNERLDLVLVVFPPPVGLDLVKFITIKTLWLNTAEDTHKTLDRSKYKTPPPFSDVIEKMLDKVKV